jgi:leucyl aminopeptidase
MVRGLRTSIPERAIAIHVVPVASYESWRAQQPPRIGSWLNDVDFAAKPGAHQLLPSADGRISGVLVVGERGNLWLWADLAAALPRGEYQIATALDGRAATVAAIGWSLGNYEFASFRKRPRRAEPSMLVVPDAADLLAVEAAVEAEYLGRDLVNRPANDLGPSELVGEAQRIAERHGAECRVVRESDLIAQSFPAIYAVGQGSPRPSALIDFRWGRSEDPKVTLVGKGVCFDTGGLTIKTEAWMRNMKKDMAGAATVLALAHMIMRHALPVRLRVLIPAIENSTSGTAYRPGDVVKTRKGLTIEIANCDAEGRVILADALTAADEEAPDLLIDVATLTGAARVALGPEIGAYFCDDDDVSRALDHAARAAHDPLWRLPLWPSYRKRIDSAVADVQNLAPNDTAGAITAALLLKDFVEQARTWIHLDVFGWNDLVSPGRPAGGEPSGLRALFHLIETRYRR